MSEVRLDPEIMNSAYKRIFMDHMTRNDYLHAARILQRMGYFVSISDDRYPLSLLRPGCTAQPSNASRMTRFVMIPPS